MHRGPYIVSAVMDESVNEDSKVFEGLYADMMENDYQIVTGREGAPDESAILFNFSKITQEELRIVGSSARVEKLHLLERGIHIRPTTADKIRMFVRVRLPYSVTEAYALDEDGNEMPVNMEWEERTCTLRISYDSCRRAVNVTETYGKSIEK